MRAEFGGDPHFNNVVLQLPLRSHLRDESKTSKAVTVNGDAKVAGGAAYFDGVGDYLSLASVVDFGFSNLDFTLEAWINPTNTSSDRGVIDLRGSFAAAHGTFFLDSTVGGKLAFWDGGTKYGASGAAVPSGVWSHTACVRHNGVLRFFLNGRLDASATIATDFSGSRPCGIGGSVATSYAGTSPFLGYIKDVRITKDVARYTFNFTPPAFLPTHGVAASRALVFPLFTPDTALITGTSAALSTNDIAAVAAVLRSTGALDATDSVDLSAIAASYDDLLAALTSLKLSAEFLGRVATVGRIAADLSDDELVVLGKAWPSAYQAATGIRLSSPVSTIGSFPPVIVSNVVLH